MVDYSKMSDEELDAFIAQQQARAAYAPQDQAGYAQSDLAASQGLAPMQGQAGYEAPITTNPYSSMSDAELDDLVAKEAAKLGDGSVVNAATGDRASDAQTQYYQAAAKRGELDGIGQWGTETRPFLGQPGIQPDPGQWYVDADGNKIQVPGQMDQGLGVQKGVMKPFNNVAEFGEWGLKKVGVPVDAINQWSHDNLGMANGVQGAREAQQAYFDQQAQEGRFPGRVGQFGGEVLGTAPLALLAPEGLAGAALTGAYSGAALTDSRDPMGIAADAGFGALGGSVLHGGNKFLSEAPILDPAKQALYRAGVPITPGQTLGYPEKMIGKVFDGANTGRDAARAAFDDIAPTYTGNIDDAMRVLGPGGGTKASFEDLAAAGYLGHAAGLSGGHVAPAYGAGRALYSNPGQKVARDVLMGDRPAWMQNSFGNLTGRKAGLIGGGFENFLNGNPSPAVPDFVYDPNDPRNKGTLGYSN